MGPHVCNFYEHACMEIFKHYGVQPPDHNPNGCIYCAEISKTKGA